MPMDWDFYTLDDFKLDGKVVLVRVDINSPIDPSSGRILNDARMRHHLATIRDLHRSKVVLLAHQSRPGKDDFTTLEAHAVRLSYLLSKEVNYVDSLFGTPARKSISQMRNGDVLLLENTRFYSEEISLSGQSIEKQSKTHIVRTLASLADYFVFDAFAAAHRSQPSLVGFTEVLPSMAGRVMEKEIVMLSKALRGEEKPTVAILGGIKVEDSVEIARSLLDRGVADSILTCGLVGNIFLLASGTDLGKENMRFIKREVGDYENLTKEAKMLLKKYKDKVHVPKDVAISDDGERVEVDVENIPPDRRILDIGIDTLADYVSRVQEAKTIVANGPAGVFEIEAFSVGTTELLRVIAESDGFSVLGGGHTVAAIEKLGFYEKMDHVSTGGGSLMAFLSGKPLPGIEALKRSKQLFAGSS